MVIARYNVQVPLISGNFHFYQAFATYNKKSSLPSGNFYL